MVLDDTSRRDALKLLGTGAAMTALGTGTAAAGSDGETVVEFDSMVGNTLTGANGRIREIDAGGLPWVVDEAEVKLDEDGALKAEVEGLVIDPDADHPAAGTNPVPEFRAILSTLTLDGDGHVIENVRTGTYAASEEGDSTIEEMVDAPEPSLAPIVFVAGPEEILGKDAWFAVTGF